ncbi:MAG: redoxin domain-containing protein [Myxococcota bacterium]
MSKTRPGRSPRPSRSFSLGLAITLACLSTLTACPEPDGASATAEASSPPAAKDETPAASAHPVGKPEPASAPRNPNERPLPAFEGTTVGGGRLALRDLLGSRVVLFFFNPEVAEAAPVAAAVESIAARAGDHNFRVVGIGVGSQTPALARFTSEHGLSFPVIDDSSGSITQLLRLRAPLAILGMDAEGYMSFAMGHFPVGPGLEEMVIGDLETQLRLDTGGTGGDGALYAWPQALELGVVAMSDGKVLETADLRVARRS